MSRRPSPSSGTGYAGIHNDLYGGMTPVGGIIKDAWVFGLISEEQTCEGWQTSQLQNLHDQVAAEWDKYGLLVGNLPPELRERHNRIHGAAIERARELGWRPGADLDSEMREDDELAPDAPR
ncbi:hypothetical protein TVNIR_2114 [Thioalkalivibrio nitratireducens DSM 14787]|uniref:Uncharacterized protein n=1 Tax=Thioalkalivibrio nitratireducens (strain DSM 14787 / UNIQEM 213 / ALEN2) TaxID=1255043 RepID=L0DW00_THIND|nr:hypothetical protein [Thioalkalivibrio nitratireducens]AGA33774.1 hypothetical protein TVNIR_2114 [Thioalkalivibrio nitratireducens DSM 14787]